MFDGLLFDLDGTLWDSVDAICISWNRALERLAPEYAGTVTRARLLPCIWGCCCPTSSTAWCRSWTRSG